MTDGDLDHWSSGPLMPLIAQAEELCGLHDHITRVITHLIPKRKYEAEIEDIEEIEREAVTGVGVVRHVPHGNEGQIHTESIMYVPSTKEDRHHAVFTTNRDVPLDMVPGFTGQYTQRWQIENEYKSIKICWDITRSRRPKTPILHIAAEERAERVSDILDSVE